MLSELDKVHIMESAPVVCCEVFDENSQPSAEEISEYAQQIGIDPESESHLLPIAKDGLMQALKPPWKAYYDESRSAHYYYNEETKSTQWEHPVDKVYRELVRKARDVSTHDDTCASLQELNTYEENTKVLEHAETKVESDDDAFSTDSEHQSELKHMRMGPKQKVSFGRPPLAPLVRPFDKKLNDLRISPLRRSADGSFSLKSRNNKVVEKEFAKLQGKHKLFKQQSEIIDLNKQLVNEEEDNYNSLSATHCELALPLAGKGNIFLRNQISDLYSPDTDKSFSLDPGTKSDSIKGILREKVFDSSQKKSETSSVGKPKPGSFEEDRKSVRFKLESPAVDSTVSPTSNSSSDQNDGQSSIISAPANPPTLSSVVSPVLSTPVRTKLSPIGSTPLVPNLVFNKPLQLSPLSSRPPLPPRPPAAFDHLSTPKESKSASGSEKEFNETDPANDRMSPKRRLLRPPAADYIKADLFKKNFHKISDLVKPGDVDSSPNNLDEPDRPEADRRPRSPMIPQKNKISINLMESIESETSIDSPDKEFANLDLNDMNDQLENNADAVKQSTETIKDSDTSDENDSVDSSKSKQYNKAEHYLSRCIEKTVRPDLDEHAKNNCHQDEIKNNFMSDSMDRSKVLETNVQGGEAKAPTPRNLSLELRSPRPAAGPGPAPHIKAPHLKSSDSTSSLKHSVSSPKLDGVIISQGKSFNRGSDNVVVMYQFEKPHEEISCLKKRNSLVSESPRDLTERSKTDEKRRLELAAYKEIEEMRADWAAKEKQMRIEFQKDLKNNEEQFLELKKIRLHEQSEKQRKDLEKALHELDKEHQAAYESAILEREERARLEGEAAERRLREQLARLREDCARTLDAERRALEAEGERALAELRDQIQAKLNRERSRLLDETKAILETLQEEQAARVADLKQDYRAEVDRLRTQHACHVEEVRSRLVNERAAATRRRGDDAALADKYRCLKEKYARLKHDVKLSIERRNKRREMSMATGSETEKSNSHKGTQSLERCKEANEANEASSSGAPEGEPPRIRVNNNPISKYNDNETSLSESQAPRSDNNNHEWKPRKENMLASPETSHNSSTQAGPVGPVGPAGAARAHRRVAVAFREPPRRRRDRPHENGATTDCQDSSDATTADEKAKEPLNEHGRRRCFTRLKSASTSRLNYSPKRGEGWSSPLESLRQQLRKLDDLEDQFPDLACQPAYSLRYPFAELGDVASADTPELEFVRHRALVEREGMRRARAVLRRRRAALRESRTAVAAHSAPSEERESTELEVALHRARALLGEKEIRLRHIERALRRLAEAPPPPPLVVQEGTSEGSSGSESETAGGAGAGGAGGAVASGAVLRSLRALHADVRDIWLALDARRPVTASPDTSSYNPASSPQPRITLSAHETTRADTSDGGVADRARGLRAWLQTAP